MSGLLVAETYTGDLGGVGNELEINADEVIYRSGGAAGHIVGGFNTVYAYPVKGLPNALQIRSRDSSGSGKIGRMFVGRGWTTIVGGSTVDEIFMVPGANDARLIIQAGTTIPGDLHVGGGLVLLSGEVDGIIYMSGGILRCTVAAADANRIIGVGGEVHFDEGTITGGTFVLAVKATETLTLSANITDGDTVTIGSRTYTWKDTLASANDVKRHATIASDSLDNLIAAINLTGTPGTDYHTDTTIHPTVYAAEGAGDTMDASANSVGTTGNSIATTKSSSNAEWGAATMSGGVDRSDLPSVLMMGGRFDAHKHGKFGTIANFHAVGEQNTFIDFRTGTRAITRTHSLKVGTPRILVDPGDTF